MPPRPRRERLTAVVEQPRNLAGPRVREARLSHRPPLTMEELCERMETGSRQPITVNMLSRIELRERYIRDYELVALARGLGVTTAWLLGESQH